MATRVTDGVSRLRRSRARVLLSLNLKKKRDYSQSTIPRSEQLRFVTEIAPWSPFLCANRGPIWYSFREGAKLYIRYNTDIAFDSQLYHLNSENSCLVQPLKTTFLSEFDAKGDKAKR